MKKLIALLLIPLVLCSCRDNAQIDEMAFVTVIGVDSADSGLRVTVGIPLPSKNDETQSKKVESYSVTCKTLSEGMELLEAQTDKRLFFGQISTIIFSESFARNGIIDTVDFLVRSPEMRFDLPIVVIKDNTAEELLSQNTENVISEKVDSLLVSVESTSVAGKIKLSKVVEMLEDPFREVYLPYLLCENIYEPYFGGYCVFKGDRINRFLSAENSLAINFLNDTVKNHISVLKLNGTDVTLKITGSKTKVNLDNGIFSINVLLDAEILQAGTEINKFDDKTSGKLCRALSNEVTENITETLDILMSDKCDATLLGDCFKKSNPHAVEHGEWSEMFPLIRYSVNTETKLDKSKTVQKPVKQKGN